MCIRDSSFPARWRPPFVAFTTSWTENFLRLGDKTSPNPRSKWSGPIGSDDFRTRPTQLRATKRRDAGRSGLATRTNSKVGQTMRSQYIIAVAAIALSQAQAIAQ